MAQVTEVLEALVVPPTKKQGFINLGLVSMLCIALALPLFNRVSNAEQDSAKTKDTVQTIQTGLSEMTGYLKSLRDMRKAELTGKGLILVDTLTDTLYIKDTLVVETDKDTT